VALELMQHEPYSLHKIHRTTQAEDDVFNGQHGEGGGPPPGRPQS
jgi:hypothetical protein